MPPIPKMPKMMPPVPKMPPIPLGMPLVPVLPSSQSTSGPKLENQNEEDPTRNLVNAGTTPEEQIYYGIPAAYEQESESWLKEKGEYQSRWSVAEVDKAKRVGDKRSRWELSDNKSFTA